MSAQFSSNLPDYPVVEEQDQNPVQMWGVLKTLTSHTEDEGGYQPHSKRQKADHAPTK